MAKGPQFERDFARMLSLWWTEGKHDDFFWRSDGSGGRATNRGKKGKTTFGQYGDIRSSHPEGHSLMRFCTIELKRGYSSKTAQDLFDRKEKAAVQLYEQWIIKTIHCAMASQSMTWILVVRRDGRKPIVFLPTSFVDRNVFQDNYNVRSEACVVLNTAIRYKKNKTARKRFWVIPLDDFFTYVEPRKIRQLLERCN